ncbi:MAG: hypothetical protein ACM3JG_03070 [Thiohalocapsa sp.]
MTITPPPETRQAEMSDREPISDYRIQPDPGQLQRPAAHHALGALRIILLLFIAAVSFALFWVAATLLGVL